MKKAARRRLLCVKKSNVVARSEATWQSPGTMSVPAQQLDGLYQEIPTGLTALGMTEKIEICTDHHVIARSVAERSGFFNNNDCRGQSYLD